MTSALLSLALAACAVTSCTDHGAQRSAAAAMTTSDTSVIVRRLIAGPNLYLHAVFPDGSRVIVGDDNGNVTAQDVASGTRTRLTTNGDWMRSRGLLEAALSRDGKSIAYAWMNGAATELRVIGADGSNDRLLRLYPSGTSVSVEDWTRAGDAVFVAEADANGSRIARIPTADGESVTVVDAGWNIVKHARVSPDGRSLAYDMLSTQSATKPAVLRIHVLDVASKKSRVLVDAGENASLTAWSPDGKVYYTTRSNGLTRLWRIPVGAQGGGAAAELVRADLPSFRAIAFAGGSLFFASRDEPVLVRHLPVDPATLAPTGAVSTLTRVPEGFVSNLVWSDDGARLAYRVRDDDGEENVAVHSRATGQDVTLSPPFRVGSSIGWSDGALLLAGTREGKAAVFTTDATFTRFDAAAALTALGGMGVPQTSVGGDVQLFVRAGANADDMRSLVVRNTRDGSERVVLRDRNIGTVRLSPDGKSIARLIANRVAVLPVGGGSERTIYTTSGADWIRGGSLGWSADSRRVVFLIMHTEETAHYSEIWQAPVEGSGASRVVRAGDEGAAVYFAISPDGRNIAFAGPERSDRRAELWVMEKLVD
jgi:Tol biopolymer transport system component